MPAAYLDENGDLVKQCTKCEKVQPVSEYYRHKAGVTKDGLQPRCRTCTLANYREQNRRRNKKRKQRTHKLTKHQVDWIKEQQGKLSIRETAKEFANKFWAIKVNPSTVQRIFSGKIHAEPSTDTDSVSIYDLLEGASDLTGSVEDYLDTVDPKKVKF
jgi:hypothetical protein